MRSFKFGIIDYKAGNLASIHYALKDIGCDSKISSSTNDLKEVDALLLPGVGAFGHAMLTLKEDGLDQFLKDFVQQGKPVLGICLGMQLMSNSSTEMGLTTGLGLIPGHVEKIANITCNVGWSPLAYRNALNIPGTIFDKKDYYYFNHSYVFHTSSKYVLATSAANNLENGCEFNAIIKMNNLYGVQFHPEKSQKAGRNFLKNLIQDIKNGS